MTAPGNFLSSISFLKTAVRRVSRSADTPTLSGATLGSVDADGAAEGVGRCASTTDDANSVTTARTTEKRALMTRSFLLRWTRDATDAARGRAGRPARP